MVSVLNKWSHKQNDSTEEPYVPHRITSTCIENRSNELTNNKNDQDR